jgi:hypothetical protein
VERRGKRRQPGRNRVPLLGSSSDKAASCNGRRLLQTAARAGGMCRFGLLLLFLLMLCIPGCGGCRNSANKNPKKSPEEIAKELEEKKKQEAERLKRDFEFQRVVSRPTVEREAAVGVKPGHWTAVALEDVKANHSDFVGELALSATDGHGAALPLFKTPFQLTVLRDAALSKGEAKRLDSLLFVPPTAERATISCRLTDGRTGRSVLETTLVPATLMPSYQYHFVVLAREPDRYRHLSGLECVRSPEEDFGSRSAPYYRVALPGVARRAPLPDHANQWTGIACMLWDDVPANVLDPAAQQAMLDWLHWGGQLIVSGPDTLELLRGSFLSPYLPAAATGVRSLDASDLAALSAAGGRSVRPLKPVRPWSGIRWEKRPGAEFLPGTGELIVERPLGRGRIVATAFRLSGRELIDWPGYDEIFNNLLLGRPHRKRVVRDAAAWQLVWIDGGHPFDAGRITRLRYFTRDAGVPLSQYAADVWKSDEENAAVARHTNVPPMNPLPESGSGVAAWNDFNPAAQAARTALQDAARITVPDRWFIVWIVAGYLVVLVPANWAFFRAIRRVEWAWVAAPIIAVVCTALVIHLAQLDIGFVRARTELAVVELQPGYGRAHVTRYDALYTSLATTYNVTCDDPGGVAMPFPTVGNPDLFRMSLGQTIRELTYRRGEKPSLRGFHIGSNTTGLLHAEGMLELGGGISLVERPDGTCRLLNGTRLALQGAGLMRKSKSGKVEIAWVGNVPAAKKASKKNSPGPLAQEGPGARADGFVPGEAAVRWITFDAVKDAKGTAAVSQPETPENPQAAFQSPFWAAERNASLESASASPPGILNLRGMLEVAQNPANCDPGETRLIAWSDDALAGMDVLPTASQVKQGVVIVAHIAYNDDK